MHRTTLLAFEAGILLLFLASPGRAQSYPARPVTIVVPFTTGSGIDLLARSLGPKLNERWNNVGVVVDNRTGAGGNIGAEIVARAAPDGHTLLMAAASFITNAAVIRPMPYDPVRTFAPIVLITTSIQALVINAGLPVQSVQELVAYAKSNPRKLFYGNPGNGTPQHLSMELFKRETGMDITNVPYKGFANAVTDVVGGHVDMMLMPVSAAVQYVRGGKIRILAVMGSERSPVFPSAPTFEQAGYGNVQTSSWSALLAPAGTPMAVVARLNADVNALLADAGIRESLVKQGFSPAGGTPEALTNQFKTELERWLRIADEAKITVD
jgi:tripartite-type tricarboxylate transporter receptor subunit TctC